MEARHSLSLAISAGVEWNLEAAGEGVEAYTTVMGP